MSERKLIYTVGDSHCWHAWVKIPFVETRTCGPMTMYSFGIHKPIVVGGIPPEAIVCFCWGEIDCRCHVHKYQPWRQMIDELVERYFAAIDENAKIHKNIWVYNVVPPPRRIGTQENPDFPFLGSDEERLNYVRYLNQKLNQGKYPFIDVYDQYCDKDGFLRMEVSDCHVHVEDERPLLEYIKNRLGVAV